MHHFAQAGFIIAGILMLAFGIAHEWTWRKRKSGRKQKGKVVGSIKELSDCTEYFHPEIEFESMGSTYKFTSKYGEPYKPIEVGTEVDVLVPSNPYDAEHYTTGNRMLFTGVSIIFGIIFVLVGAAIKS
ncbi:DUF3592 domain-containing protein [Cerasicoccus fimbriatus]|uniref:DUF3592 domain-containing protein n=1 Tax=Cerasicoccus fimbriatus TaxID=3014554 RepID=UPI0022B3A4EF|nr:DUF3592 domain-containing protein [Cerasicoccus sp. TK19100]